MYKKLLTTLLILLVAVPPFTYCVESYKSIKPIEINKHDWRLDIYTYSSYDALIQIKNLETDILEYLENGSNSDNDKEIIYNLYLNNLLYYASFLDYLRTMSMVNDDSHSLDYAAQTFEFNDIKYIYTRIGYANYDITIKSPVDTCKSITFANNGEGIDVLQINTAFQYQLSEYLDSNWRKYWHNRLEEQQALKGSFSIVSDGSLVLTLEQMGNFIKLWSDFQKINTNKDLEKDIEDRINRYIYVFLYPNIYDFENWGRFEADSCQVDSDVCIRPLTQAGKLEFENLLTNISKDTNAYKILSNSYQILKKNNYKTSEEYYKSFVKDLE